MLFIGRIEGIECEAGTDERFKKPLNCRPLSLELDPFIHFSTQAEEIYVLFVELFSKPFGSKGSL